MLQFSFYTYDVFLSVLIDTSPRKNRLSLILWHTRFPVMNLHYKYFCLKVRCTSFIMSAREERIRYIWWRKFTHRHQFCIIYTLLFRIYSRIGKVYKINSQKLIVPFVYVISLYARLDSIHQFVFVNVWRMQGAIKKYYLM